MPPRRVVSQNPRRRTHVLNSYVSYSIRPRQHFDVGRGVDYSCSDYSSQVFLSFPSSSPTSPSAELLLLVLIILISISNSYTCSASVVNIYTCNQLKSRHVQEHLLSLARLQQQQQQQQPTIISISILLLIVVIIIIVQCCTDVKAPADQWQVRPRDVTGSANRADEGTIALDAIAYGFSLALLQLYNYVTRAYDFLRLSAISVIASKCME